MICRFCGMEIKTRGPFSLASSVSEKCDASPLKKHVAISDGQHCVYCGQVVKPRGIQGLASQTGLKCPNSPTAKHSLQ